MTQEKSGREKVLVQCPRCKMRFWKVFEYGCCDTGTPRYFCGVCARIVEGINMDEYWVFDGIGGFHDQQNA